MMKMAAEDTPKRETYSYGWSSHERTVYQYGLYMRCQTLSGFFLSGPYAFGRKPASL